MSILHHAPPPSIDSGAASTLGQCYLRMPVMPLFVCGLVDVDVKDVEVEGGGAGFSLPEVSSSFTYKT